MNTQTLIQAKKKRKKWVMLTAYDAPTAEILQDVGVDFILVGDSLGMVVLGYPGTAQVTMDEMIHHCKAVRRGAPQATVIGDMPLLGVNKGPMQALESAKRFVREGGCNAVKIEWNPHCLATAKLLVRNRIPVMAHLGLTPQTAGREGYKVRGREASQAMEIWKRAGELEKAGVFSVLLECVPSPLARRITRSLKVPVFGIGAGPHCDGQVLVFHDMVGLFEKLKARFVRRYAKTRALWTRAAGRFAEDVRRGRFPKEKNAFRMPPEEEKILKKLSAAEAPGVPA